MGNKASHPIKVHFALESNEGRVVPEKLPKSSTLADVRKAIADEEVLPIDEDTGRRDLDVPPNFRLAYREGGDLTITPKRSEADQLVCKIKKKKSETLKLILVDARGGGGGGGGGGVRVHVVSATEKTSSGESFAEVMRRRREKSETPAPAGGGGEAAQLRRRKSGGVRVT